MNAIKRPTVGMRVVFEGPSVLGPPTGTHGTVALVATGRGKSVHPDPSRLMTFVRWDNGSNEGVYTRHLGREALRT